MRVYRDDQKFLTFRINALLWAIVAVFVFLAGSFWVVQGVQAEKYRNLSEANALREIVTPAKRGLIVDRTRRQGVLRGDGATGAQLYDIPSLADVKLGDVVMTAGIDGIYPKGIPVGVITKAEKGQDLFKTITVRPSVDFGAIEEVIILHTRKVPNDVVRYAP